MKELLGTRMRALFMRSGRLWASPARSARGLASVTASHSFELSSQSVKLPLPKSEGLESILENRRLRTFTEEKLAFALPLYSREQVALGMASTQG